ncbi:MAG TPA: hypothetical protein DCL73_08940 [Treponema sp.]|nr:hypothetical protein [Treponema sp.]
MKRSYVIFTLFALISGITACSSTPVEAQQPPAENYIATGIIYSKLAGHQFYSGIAQVEMTRINGWGNEVKTGKYATIAVAVRVDSETGLIQQIVTMKPERSEPDGKLTLNVADLGSGALLADFSPYDKWIDAITNMQETSAKLHPVADDSSNEDSAHIYLGVGIDPWWWGAWPAEPRPRPRPRRR